ncbi:hypothetical protein [Leeia oryzae]|uniref:hypothetical protein n=1 Tax=Leeia oryzae TaxID=356662 RepID=UPI00036599DD|nr:hypothetical protein [Leeia oryzae]
MKPLHIARLLVLSALCFCCIPSVHAARAMEHVFIHNGPESADDKRYAYHWRVLKAALDITRFKYGAYQIKSAKSMTESRQVIEMTSDRGLINTMVLDSTDDLEKRLYPVKIPIDKGLIGYRVFLIRAEDQPKFSRVASLEDLKQFTVGQGADWSDVSIYKAAGFNVTPASTYESLFPMLMFGRFDAIGRGVNEVADEMITFGNKFPDMMIENQLMLYYPLPMYFFFPKTDNGLLRAKRVEEGMRLLIKNGTLDQMFRAEFSKVLASLNLKQRKLFKIPNPRLTTPQPYDQAEFWFNPAQ